MRHKANLLTFGSYPTCLVWLSVLAYAWLPLLSCGADAVRFNEDVRPILSHNCFACHGPDASDRQADLRLDVEGSVDFDELVARVTSDDPNYVMPPPESHKQLSSTQIDQLVRWVEAGAPYETHWSFRAPTWPAVHSNAAPIDQLVERKFDEARLAFSPGADRRTLIRRLTLDLTGLPPTSDEIDGFLADDSSMAYEKLVEQLLASPHYGEHMARYWLDLVRFADTNGLHHDHYREMTPFRDWVIRAYNENMPFDQFVMYQLAGDLYDQPTTDQQIASGFNRLHLIIDVGTALPEESFHRNVVDRVTAVGTAFLGLTLQCAECHDHKYDPITQREFYQLYAFFNNFDGEPETGHRGSTDFRRGLQPPYIEFPSAEQTRALEEIKQQTEELTNRIEQLNAEAESEPDDAATGQAGDAEAQDNQIEQLQKELEGLKLRHDEILASVPATLVMKERAEPRPTHVLLRGAYDQPGDLVGRDTPAFLPPIKGNTQPAPSRLDLAEWLVDPAHPLTARVAVNRFWQQLFGVGLVKTSEDFGAQGEPPSHRELLDYLARRFVELGWDVKSLLREIVLSRTYRQTSRVPTDDYLRDPDNRFLARGSRYRLDGEVIRDQVLSVTGLLNRSMYGRSVKTPQPDGLWQTVTMPSSYPRAFQADEGSDAYRRSIYTFWKRGMPPPQMTIFDAPTRESCIARRERTNTPLQALVLMNERQYFAAAMHYANRLLEPRGLNDQQRLGQAYGDFTAQLRNDETLKKMQASLELFRRLYHANRDSARAMMTYCDQGRVPDSMSGQIELAAWTMVVHAMMNLEITKMRY